MPIIVNDEGFHPAEPIEYDDVLEVWIEPDGDYHSINIRHASLISIHFPSFNDGRGFGIARLLRAKGYTGRLRAVGHIIADQYTMARRVGFDEIEISNELAARQDASQWKARSDWQQFDYQARLGQTARA